MAKVRRPSVSSKWHATISAHVNFGETNRALQLFQKMKQEGITPNQAIILCCLKACSSIRAIEQGRLIHDQAIRSGFELNGVIGNTIIDMYAKCGVLEEAWKVFDELPKKSVVSWSVIIAGSVQHGQGFMAVEAFEKMQQGNLRPSKVTLLFTLKACVQLGSIEKGRLIHDHIVKSGLGFDMVVGSTLIDMYAKCGRLEEAQKVFDAIPDKDAVLWNTIIAGYSQHRQGLVALNIFREMQQNSVDPTKATFLCTLKACGCVEAIEHGRLLHEQIIVSGFESDDVVGSSLTDMYAKYGKLDDARKIFDHLPYHNVVSWSVMIAGYAHHGHGLSALDLFDEMQRKYIPGNSSTFLGVLKACGGIQALGQGRRIHDQLVRNGLEADVVIGSALIDMYVKCGSLKDAHDVFDKLLNRNVVSWGTIIAGYAQHGHGLPALDLFEKMQKQGILPNRAVFLCALKACSTLGDTGQGRLVHDQIIRSGLQSELVIESTLVDMYAKCGSMNEAYGTFCRMARTDEVSWNAIIAGYAQHGDGLSALDLFAEMLWDEVEPDTVTFLSVMQACGSVGAILQGRLIHNMIIRKGLASDMAISSMLVDTYARCGSMEEAHRVFSKLADQDVVSWGALIAGYAEQGNWRMAKNCFQDMEQQGLKPDSKIFTSMLAACSHAGEVEEGRQYFKSMREAAVTPSTEHFNCMIDLLGNAGCLNEALKVIHTMPISPDITGWMSLLSSCRKYGNIQLGSKCFSEVVQLDPNIATGYVLMSNMYSDVNMWVDSHKTQQWRNCLGAWKKPGSALIEVRHRVHQFNVADNVQPYEDETHFTLERLQKATKKAGHVPQLDTVLKQMLVSEQEEGSCGHTLKRGHPYPAHVH